MEVYRTMGAMASVVLLWAGVVSTSAASDTLTYRCQTESTSYTQRVSIGESLQVSLRSNGRMQEITPDTDNNPLILADELSAHCTPLSASEAKSLWPEGAQVTRVHFDFDQASLTDSARATLASMAQRMRASNQQFLVEGHTDSSGKEPYNQRLGQLRAERVGGFLADLGVPPERLLVRSRGEAEPVEANLKTATSSQNRRVEIIVRKPG